MKMNNYSHKYRNESLITIFNNTIEIVNNIEKRNSKTVKYNNNDIILDINDHNAKGKGHIQVLPSDTISTSLIFGNNCILNMASPKRPGGGVKRGTKAQEESLFRCTNLFETITEDFYPLYDSALYTKDAIIIKDFNYHLLNNFKTVDVITIAAEKLNDKMNNKKENYNKIMKDKIRLMLSLPYKHGIKTLILGAWGCGVYNNDPKEVATMFKEILIDEKYRYLYDKIIFAIINDHNSVGDNYDIFQNILEK